MKSMTTLFILSLTILLAAPALSRTKVNPNPSSSVNLNAQISHGYVLADHGHEILATIDMRAQDVRSETRVPMNLSVVLDRSGSMQGERFVQAKKATRDLIEMLESGDRLSLVTYGDDVTLEFPSMFVTASNKKKMIAVVDALRVDGWTNLSGGLEMGLKQARAHAKEETINRVILMSDGHANRGITDINGLAALARSGLEVGVSTSTLGFGLDYNAALMTKMAVEGAGNYYFIEREDALAAVFVKEIQGLSSTVARNARVAIDLAPGVELLELHGFTHRQTGNRILVPLAEFAARQNKDLFLKLHANGQPQGQRLIANVRLIYFDVVADREVTIPVDLRTTATSNASLVEEKVNANVVARGQQIDIAKSLNDAMAKYEKGETEEAVKVLKEQRARTGQAKAKYKLSEESFGRVDKELSKMEDDMAATPAASAPARRMRKENSVRSQEVMMDATSF